MGEIFGRSSPAPGFARHRPVAWIWSGLAHPCSPWRLRLTTDHRTLPEVGQHASGCRLRPPPPRGLDLLAELGHLEAWQEPTRTKPRTLYIVNPKSSPPAGARH